jgi:hypothetical protein
VRVDDEYAVALAEHQARKRRESFQADERRMARETAELERELDEEEGAEHTPGDPILARIEAIERHRDIVGSVPGAFRAMPPPGWGERMAQKRVLRHQRAERRRLAEEEAAGLPRAVEAWEASRRAVIAERDKAESTADEAKWRAGDEADAALAELGKRPTLDSVTAKAA